MENKYSLTSRPEKSFHGNFDRLFAFDTALRYDVITLIHDAWSKSVSLSKNDVIIGGSTVEGSMVARYFAPKFDVDPRKRLKCMVNREIEVDFNFLTATLPSHMKHIVVDKPNCTNIVNVRCCNELYSLINNEYDRMLFKERQDREFLKSWTLKESFLKTLKLRYLLPYLRDLMAEAAGENISIKDRFGEITKASAAIEFDIIRDNKPWFCASIDMAIMLKIMWWPDTAAAWITRTRNWPSPEEIEELTKHAFIIAKPSASPGEKDNPETFEFSYSYHEVETKLSQSRSTKQQRIYFIFKSLYYRFLKSKDKDHIPSFWAKTVMFWLMEEYPPSSEFWDDAIQTVHFMFKTLRSAILNEKLNYYFNPDINLFEGYIISKGKEFPSVKRKLLDSINIICKNVEVLVTTLPIEPCEKFYEGIKNTMNKCSKLMLDGFEKEKEIDFWNVPVHDEGLVERKDVLPDILKYLSWNQGVSLTGISGAGKTELAAQFCRNYGCNFDGVFWIPCEKEVTLRETFKNLADHLGVNKSQGNDIVDVSKLVHDIYDLPKFMFFVFDDINPGQASLLPTNQAFILTSTSCSSWPKHIHNITIEEVSEDIALELLKKKIPSRLYDIDGAKRIFSMVGGSPIALSLSASYMVNKDVTTTEFSDVIHDSPKQLFSKSIDDRYSKTLSCAFYPTIKVFQNDESYWLLEVLSLMDGTRIEKVLLNRLENNSNIDEIISEMVKFSLLKSPDTHYYQMSTLTQNFIQSQIKDASIPINRVLSVIGQEIEISNEDHYSYGENWAHHMVSIINRCQNNDTIIHAMYSHKDALVDAFQNTSNEGSLLKVLHVYSEYQERDNHPESLETKRQIAVTLRRLGKYDECQVLLETIHHIAEQSLGEYHIDSLRIKSELAVCFRKMGGKRHAKGLLKQVLNAAKSFVVGNLSFVDECKEDYADACVELAEYEEAIPLYNELSKCRGRDVKILSDLAGCYTEMGNYDTARELLTDAISTGIERHGIHHSITMKARDRLGYLLWKTKQYADAKVIFEELYHQYKKLYGVAIDDTLAMKMNLASCLYEMGECERGIKMLEEIHDSQKQTLGEMHSRTLITKYNLGGYYVQQGFPRKALPLLLHVKEAWMSIYGPSHPDTINAWNAIRVCMEKLYFT